LLADPEARKIAPIALRDPERTPANAHRIGIVKNDDPIVSRQPKVALDPGAELERRCECNETILGKAGAVVKPAVRKSGRPRIERIRP
jgi:hypothetical protein